MTKAQHTPGPWRIGDAGQTVFGPKSDQPSPITIATLPGETPRVATSERKANACLIAAAPELLEALQRLLWKAQDQLYALKNSRNNYTDSSEYVSQLKDYINNARAAITKAKGEQS